MLQSYKDFNNSFKKARTPLSYSGGHTASNCETYFDLAPKHDIEETVHNQAVKSEYLICDALKILSDSYGAPDKRIDFSSMGELLLSQLDLRSFSSSLYRAADENTHTLQSLFPQSSSATGPITRFDSEDWAFTLEVVAVANMNDNSAPDWIVWVLDEAKEGNYRGYSTLIIYDPEQQEPLKATTYP
ncbi:MAG: hypothetical protein MI754_11590 [Chromatiales bacterium]|nr:hypothetical protein [Chromatiales bacterium]